MATNVISATKNNLHELVNEDKFRDDLYYQTFFCMFKLILVMSARIMSALKQKLSVMLVELK